MQERSLLLRFILYAEKVVRILEAVKSPRQCTLGFQRPLSLRVGRRRALKGWIAIKTPRDGHGSFLAVNSEK